MEVLETLALGIPVTLVITLSALAIGAILALPLLFAGRSRYWIIRVAAQTLIDIVRGVPPLVWLFVLYYGISIGAFRFEPIPAAIAGFSVISATYLAEIYRGALAAVPSAQFEASHAMSLPRWAVAAEVIGPQAFRVAVPSMTTYAIVLLKETAVASVIGVSDIAFRALSEARISGESLGVFILAAAMYILLGAPLAWLARIADARMRAAVTR